eukprot:8210014-Pyramimonas_sp.AAC.1
MSKLLLGDSSINLEKLAEEGELSTEKLIWGLLFQLEDSEGRVVDRATLPEPKIQKMSYLLQEAELEPGQRVVQLKTVQRLR